MANRDLVLQITTSLSNPKLDCLSGLWLLPVMEYPDPVYGTTVGTLMHIYRDMGDDTWKLIEHQHDKKVLLAYCQEDTALVGTHWYLTSTLGKGSIQIHSWARSQYEIKQTQLATSSCKTVISKFSAECTKMAADLREMKEVDLKKMDERVNQVEDNNKALFSTMVEMKEVVGTVRKRQLEMDAELAPLRDKDRCRCVSPSNLRALDNRKDKLFEGQSVLTGKRGRFEKVHVIMQNKSGVYASTRKGARNEFYRHDQVWLRDPCSHCRVQKKHKQD